MLGHVSSDDLIDIIQRNVLKANGAEGGFSVLWFLFNVECLSVCRVLALGAYRMHQRPGWGGQGGHDGAAGLGRELS